MGHGKQKSTIFSCYKSSYYKQWSSANPTNFLYEWNSIILELVECDMFVDYDPFLDNGSMWLDSFVGLPYEFYSSWVGQVVFLHGVVTPTRCFFPPIALYLVLHVKHNCMFVDICPWRIDADKSCMGRDLWPWLLLRHENMGSQVRPTSDKYKNVCQAKRLLHSHRVNELEIPIDWLDALPIYVNVQTPCLWPFQHNGSSLFPTIVISVWNKWASMIGFKTFDQLDAVINYPEGYKTQSRIRVLNLSHHDQ